MQSDTKTGYSIALLLLIILISFKKIEVIIECLLALLYWLGYSMTGFRKKSHVDMAVIKLVFKLNFMLWYIIFDYFSAVTANYICICTLQPWLCSLLQGFKIDLSDWHIISHYFWEVSANHLLAPAKVMFTSTKI